MQASFTGTSLCSCRSSFPGNATGSRIGLRVPPKQSRAVTATAMAIGVGEAAAAVTMYDVLSVAECAGQEEIKAAFRKLARRCHPDACAAANKNECTEVFIRVREAYGVLSDPVLRREYDFRLRNYGDDPASLNRRGGSWFGDWEAQLEGLRTRRCSDDRGAGSSWASRMRASRRASASSSTS